MKTLFDKTLITYLAPGSTFVFEPTDQNRSTILKIQKSPLVITYVIENDEEEHTMEGSDAEKMVVFLVVDHYLRAKRRMFRRSLDSTDSAIFMLLMKVPVNSFVGACISGVLSNPLMENFQTVVKDLSAQARQNKNAMIQQMGHTLTNLLLVKS